MNTILLKATQLLSRRRALGLLRSYLIYYGNPLKLRRMRHFYAQFIRPDDLCFDIGAHLGNRINVWSSLGARVVGVEPSRDCMKLLRRWYGKRANVTLVEEAVGATIGTQTLWISDNAPTVTSLSRRWIEQVQQVDSFAHVRWERAATVQVTTLDQLIVRMGEPVFCKIDIEGYELEALQGLSRPLAALSFEYIPATQEMACTCVERLEGIGHYEFNWSIGEQHRWQSATWVDAKQMIGFLTNTRSDDQSGDIYARRIKKEAQWEFRG